jgi:SNF2 family DNA or RNA helicase
MELAQRSKKHLVVIAPNRVHKQWKTEAVKFYGNDKFLDTFYFEQIRTDKGKQALKDVLFAKDCILVIDESHRIKNHQTKTFKICLAAGKVAKRRIIMTGSPIANSPADMWSQFCFLFGKDKMESYTDFCNEYIEFLPSNHPMVRSLPGRPRIPARDKQGKIITKNLDDLKQRISAVSTQVTAAECRDIPEVTYTTIECKLSRELRTAYNSMEQEMMMNIQEQLITADNVISMLTRLSMLTSGIATAELGTVFDNPKKQDLLSILSTHEDVPAIVWTRWKDEYRQMLDILIEHGYKVTSDAVVFQDGLADIFLSSPAQGGTGLNLTRAKLQIWVSRSWSAIERTQALARNNRAGQDANHLHVYDLVAQNTIDQRIMQALHDKEDLLNTILTKRKL